MTIPLSSGVTIQGGTVLVSGAPPPDVQKVYLDSSVQVVRRIEVFELDGVTPWTKYKVTNRDIIDGSVSVDYTRDERRSLELTLDNSEGYFTPDSKNFWYDKVIKVFRGVVLPPSFRNPKVVVILDTTSQYLGIRDAFARANCTDVQYKSQVTTYSQVSGFDVIVANFGNSDMSITPQSTIATILGQAFSAGKSIISIGSQGTSTALPLIFGATRDSTSGIFTYFPYLAEQPDLAQGWSNASVTLTGTMYMPGGTLPAGVKRFATATTSAPFYAVGTSLNANVSIAGVSTIANQRWVHLAAPPIIDQSPTSALITAADWVNPKRKFNTYEVQIGEFMIDQISEANFPSTISISGRDYTKRLLASKFAASTSFPKTAFAETTIKTLATNGGINTGKITIPSSRTALGRVVLFDRGTDRWAAIKQLALAANLEVYFDARGYLVVRTFQDPTNGSVYFGFETGYNGSIATWSRNANDTSLFNHIVVAGESSDSTTVPKWAEASNTSPTSPSSIANIGDRTMVYTSPLMTTTAQCLDLAKRYLAIYQLEEYSLDWTAFVFDWLEAGDAINVWTDRPTPGAPTTFLMTNFTIPLTLGPMSATGKRMLVVK